MTGDEGEYRFLVGSDIHRDGMYLEMSDAQGACVSDVFYSDVTDKMVVTLDKPSLPIEAVEHLLAMAKLRLPTEKRGKAASTP
jgi:hypothetical protein